ARFEQAETLAKTGDKKGAEAIYQAIAGDSGVDPEFRDLATLLSVMRGFADADAKTSIARLAPLTEAGKPWRATALELTAAAQLKAGDKASALAIYKKLADDLSAPGRLRPRAAEIAAALSASPEPPTRPIAMNRRDFAALLLASRAPAACDWFAGDKEAVLPGKRISVLGLD